MRKQSLLIFAKPWFWIILFSLIWAVVFGLDLLPVLRGGWGWEWDYKPMLERYRTLPLILGILIYVPAGLWLRERRPSTPLLAWAFLGGIALSLAAVHVRGDVLFRLYSVTISGMTGGWYKAATRIQDLGQTLGNWPQFMIDSTRFSTHMGISPPGMVVAYYWATSLLARVPALAAFLEAPVRPLLCQYTGGRSAAAYAAAWLGMLMPVWGALTIIPMYALGRQIFGEGAARWSVLWWPLIPSFLMFTPLPNAFYPLPALIMVALLWQGLRRNQIGWVIASGALMSLLTFATFTFFPLFLLAGFLTLGIYWIKSREEPAARPKWFWPFQIGLAYGLGLVSAWVMFRVAGGSSFWSIWATAQQAHLALDRPYWPWLWLHLNDFFMFSGWPFALLAIVAAWRAIRSLQSGSAPTAANMMLLAFALTVILLDLSGTMRGESGRILLFLTPWLLLGAGYVLAEDLRGGQLVTLTQSALTIVMVVMLAVVGTEYKAHAAPVPPPVKYAASNPTVYSSGATFGGTAQLVSFSGKIDTAPDANGVAQPFLYLWLTWHPTSYIDVPYAYGVRPFQPSEQNATQAASVAPFGDDYPSTCWKPSDGAITDRIRVQLPSSAPGDWWANLSLTDVNSGQPADITLPDGSHSSVLTLGPLSPFTP
jgi:hypothetical protein